MIRSEPSFTPYYALIGKDAARLSYLAEIQLDKGAANCRRDCRCGSSSRSVKQIAPLALAPCIECGGCRSRLPP